jgi:hypothetical protein
MGAGSEAKMQKQRDFQGEAGLFKKRGRGGAESKNAFSNEKSEIAMGKPPANDPDFCSNGAKRCPKPLKHPAKMLNALTKHP